MFSRLRRGAAAAVLIGLTPAQAAPEVPEEIGAVVANWYAELQKAENGRPELFTATGFIDSTPYYDYPDTGSAALPPRIYTSLPARAEMFRYRIEGIRLDTNFARVEVDERGYFCASAIPQTYENSSSTTFVLERQERDGRWLILAHQTGSYGISPGRETVPMPDLCD